MTTRFYLGFFTTTTLMLSSACGLEAETANPGGVKQTPTSVFEIRNNRVGLPFNAATVSLAGPCDMAAVNDDPRRAAFGGNAVLNITEGNLLGNSAASLSLLSTYEAHNGTNSHVLTFRSTFELNQARMARLSTSEGGYLSDVDAEDQELRGELTVEIDVLRRAHRDHSVVIGQPINAPRVKLEFETSEKKYPHLLNGIPEYQRGAERRIDYTFDSGQCAVVQGEAPSSQTN